MNTEEKRDAILKALSDERYKWRTVRGVVKQTGLPESDVLDVIRASDSVVQSSVPSSKGEELYATRDHHHKKASGLEKLFGAFKGRIR